MSLTADDVTNMMDLLDSDGDGEVSKEEFEVYFRRINPMSDAEFEKIWLKMDKNGDNALQFEELCDYYKIPFGSAVEQLQERKEMDDEMILEALRLQTALLEEKQRKEAAEKTKKKRLASKRTGTGARPGVTIVKQTVPSKELEMLQECDLKAIDKVAEMIQEGVNVRIEDEKAEGPLHKLAKAGASVQIAEILDRLNTQDPDIMDADLNAQDKLGYTPLMHAAAWSNKYVVKTSSPTSVATQLLNRNADLESETANGWNVLHVCAHNDSIDVAKCILEFIEKVYTDRKTLRSFVNHSDRDGRTPLHIASFRSSEAMVQMLINKGADPTKADNNQIEPATLAKKGGRVKSKEIIDEAIKKKESHAATHRRRSVSYDEMPPLSG